jgi:hypothetical protein
MNAIRSISSDAELKQELGSADKKDDVINGNLEEEKIKPKQENEKIKSYYKKLIILKLLSFMEILYQKRLKFSSSYLYIAIASSIHSFFYCSDLFLA